MVLLPKLFTRNMELMLQLSDSDGTVSSSVLSDARQLHISATTIPGKWELSTECLPSYCPLLPVHILFTHQVEVLVLNLSVHSVFVFKFHSDI